MYTLGYTHASINMGKWREGGGGKGKEREREGGRSERKREGGREGGSERDGRARNTKQP